MKDEKDEGVILVGGGGHALSLAEFASSGIKGYVANSSNEAMPGEWIGDDRKGLEMAREGEKFHVAFVYSGLPVMARRRRIIEEYEKAGALFSSLISPTSIVTHNSVVGAGSAIMTGAIINRARLGSHVIVNSGAIVEHDCEVGDNTFIGPGAIVGGFTKIGRNCFIGLGAKVGNGLTIADDVTVAMGAVVNHDLTEPGIYHGTPLRRSKARVRND